MDAPHVHDAKAIVEVSKAMSGPRIESGDSALADVQDRLRRVMASIERSLVTSPAAATGLVTRPTPTAPCHHATAAPVTVAVTATPAPSAAPSALSSSCTSRSSSHQSSETLTAPPARANLPARKAVPSTTAALSSSGNTVAPRAVTALLPDTSALLERWLRQDSPLRGSPLRPPPPLHAHATAADERAGLVEDSLLWEEMTHTAQARPATGTGACGTTSTVSGLFSASAEALWSSALSTAKPAKPARADAREVGQRAGLSSLPRAIAASTGEAVAASLSLSWLPTTAAATAAAETPRERSTARSRTWLPSSLLTDLADLSALPSPPRRAAPSAVVGGLADAHDDDVDDGPDKSALVAALRGLGRVAQEPALTPAALRRIEGEEADRLFSILSARYTPIPVTPDAGTPSTATTTTTTTAAVAAGEPAYAEDAERTVLPSVPAAAALSSDGLDTQPGDPHVALDGVVRSPPRAPVSDSQTQTTPHEDLADVEAQTQTPDSTDGAAPEARRAQPDRSSSLLAILHSRFHEQAASLLADRRPTADAWQPSSRRSNTTPSHVPQCGALSSAHSALLVRRTRASAADDDASPCAHEESARQVLMEAKRQRAHRPAPRGTGGHPAPSTTSRTWRSPERTGPFAGADGLARYRARCVAIEAEENRHLGDLLARYEAALHASSTPCRGPAVDAEDSVAAGGDDRDGVRTPSPVPREAANVERRVALLRHLGVGVADRHHTRAPPTAIDRHTQPPASPPRSTATSRGLTHDDDEEGLAIPTPAREQMRATSLPTAHRDGSVEVDPLSIEREPTPERAVAPLAAHAWPHETAERAVRGWSPELGEDEHTQRPPPARPARPAPRQPPPITTAQLHVSPERRGRYGTSPPPSRGPAGACALAASSSSSSYSSSRDSVSSPSSRVSRAASCAASCASAGAVARAQLQQRVDGGHARRSTATQTREDGGETLSVPRAQPAEVRAATPPARHTHARARRATAGFESAVHHLQTRGLMVSVQLAKTRVPALLQLSADRTELLFVLHKHTVAAGTAPAAGATPPPTPPHSHAHTEPPSRRPHSPPTQMASPRRVSGPASAGGLVLNTAAASQRFATPPKMPRPASSSSAAPPVPPVAPVAGKQKVRLRTVQAADGRAVLVPAVGPSPPAVGPPSRIAFLSSPPPHARPTSPPNAVSMRRALVEDGALTTVQIRERHHFPLRHARVLLPRHVLGRETAQHRAGPRGFEDVHGLLCGPAACEVLRRYRCTLFTDLTAWRTYRVFLVIPEFRRIDVPENAVLLVIDCRTRRDWVTVLLALQGIVYGTPCMSYGRALWLLAAHRCHNAHALKGLNPFETEARFAVTRPPRALPPPPSPASTQVPKPRDARLQGHPTRATRRAGRTTSQPPPHRAPIPPTSLLYRSELPAPPDTAGVSARARVSSVPSPSTPSLRGRPPPPASDAGQSHLSASTRTEAVSTETSGRRASSVQALRRLFSRSLRRHHTSASESGEGSLH